MLKLSVSLLSWSSCRLDTMSSCRHVVIKAVKLASCWNARASATTQAWADAHHVHHAVGIFLWAFKGWPDPPTTARRMMIAKCWQCLHFVLCLLRRLRLRIRVPSSGTQTLAMSPPLRSLPASPVRGHLWQEAAINMATSTCLPKANIHTHKRR